MITSVIEMVELPNFTHISTHTMQFESPDKIVMVMSWT